MCVCLCVVNAGRSRRLHGALRVRVCVGRACVRFCVVPLAACACVCVCERVNARLCDNEVRTLCRQAAAASSADHDDGATLPGEQVPTHATDLLLFG